MFGIYLCRILWYKIKEIKMIWVNTNSNGEKIVFEKKGSDVRSMKINKENTESFVTLEARAKEWFGMGYSQNWKKEL